MRQKRQGALEGKGQNLEEVMTMADKRCSEHDFSFLDKFATTQAVEYLFACRKCLEVKTVGMQLGQPQR